MPQPPFWIDGHLDLAYLAVCGRDITQPTPIDDDSCLSLPALREGGIGLVFGTIFTEPGDTEREPQMYRREDPDSAHAAGVRQLNVYEELERRGELTIVRDQAGLSGESPSPKVIILMEGADPIRSAVDAAWWFTRGVRIVGLTWATGSRYAGGNATGGPLNSAGRDLIAAFDETGIVHDASHLSEQAFWDLLDVTDKLVIASHSNSRTVMNDNNERHLSDAQIRAINERGGVIGLNLFSKFLAKGRRATIQDCLNHIEHICTVMGRRRGIALGSDMDGGFGASHLAECVDRPQSLDSLANALRSAGWNDDDVDGFTHKNWMRIVGESCKAKI